MIGRPRLCFMRRHQCYNDNMSALFLQPIPIFISDHQITPVIFKMIWAMIVEPRNVPANVKIATTTIANPCFLNVSTSFPMEIPAYARIGVQSGRSPIFPICSIA